MKFSLSLAAGTALFLSLAFAPLALSQTREKTPAPQTASTGTDTIPGEKDTLERNKKLPDFAKLHNLVKGKEGITWIITGDSITHGCAHTHGERAYAEHWMELIRWEHRRYNDTVINTGISGDTVVKKDNRDLGILNKFDDRIKRFDPQVVSVNTGMNDCHGGTAGIPAFKKNLTEAVTRIRAIKAIPVLQVPSLTYLNEGCKDNLHAYSQAIREVADKEKVLLVDHEAHWIHFAGTKETRDSWLNNSIHPNGKGHAEMYKKMAYDLGLFDPKKPSCQLGDKTL